MKGVDRHRRRPDSWDESPMSSGSGRPFAAEPCYSVVADFEPPIVDESVRKDGHLN